jgi:4-amino-4-deoxy-L-arabinose transferase-like glycosyltransferase
MLSVYGIGERLGNKKAGLLAALLTPILPIFLTVQEKAAIDYPSVSVFIASFYLLFKTENFTNRKYSILFGLSIFAGLLIKWPFVIPAIPFVFYAIRSLYSSRHNRRPVATNISLALLVLLPAISWYLFNHNSLVTKLSFFWNPNGFAQILWSNPHGLNFQNLLLYSFKSPLEPAGVGIIVLVSFYVSLFKVHKKYNERLLLLSIAITYIVLTFLDDKSSLYMIYTYPLAMILILVTLYKIKGLRRDVLIVILSISILTNFTLTQLNYTQVFLADLLKDSIYILPNYDTKYIYGVWQTQNIVNFAYERGGCSENMLVFPDRRFLNPSTVNFYIVSKGINSFAMPAYAYYNPASDGYFDTSRLSSYQCIISTTGDPGTFANKEVLDQVNNYLLSHREYKLKTYSEPDGETILLFIKI